jgi:hypothetical protein
MHGECMHACSHGSALRLAAALPLPRSVAPRAPLAVAVACLQPAAQVKAPRGAAAWPLSGPCPADQTCLLPLSPWGCHPYGWCAGSPCRCVQVDPPCGPSQRPGASCPCCESGCDASCPCDLCCRPCRACERAICCAIGSDSAPCCCTPRLSPPLRSRAGLVDRAGCAQGERPLYLNLRANPRWRCEALCVGFGRTSRTAAAG